jgi:FkbM family methyltransferase
MNEVLFRLGQALYRSAPALYRPVYSFYKAWSDRRERAHFKRIIRPGMTVVDVGANIGVYARFFAGCVGPGGRVVAFEPELQNVRLLRETVRRFPQVTVVHAAVSDKSGTLQLFIADDLNVDHHSYDSGDGRGSVTVDAISLDDYFGDGSRVDIVKIDVQGAEMGVLNGALKLLAKNPHLEMLLEFWPWGLRNAGASAEAFLRFFAERDYLLEELSQESAADLRAIPECKSVYLNVRARRKV